MQTTQESKCGNCGAIGGVHSPGAKCACSCHYTRNVSAMELAWGLRVAGLEKPALWGFRAIYTERDGGIDILWDRQTLLGPEGVFSLDTTTGPDTLKLYHALNGKNGDGAISKLRAWSRKHPFHFHPGKTDVSKVPFGGVMFQLSTQASFGYLYGVAYLDR